MAGKSFLVVLAVLALAGCGPVGGAGTVKPQLPAALNARALEARAGCATPVAHVGEDARAFAKRAVIAFNCEQHTLDETVRFYNSLRLMLAGA